MTLCILRWAGWAHGLPKLGLQADSAAPGLSSQLSWQGAIPL